jgi:peptide/nickel transport system permease protein
MTKNNKQIVNMLPNWVLKFWGNYAKMPSSVVSLITFIVLVLASTLAPLITPHLPFDISTGDPFLSPNLSHPFGTNDLGQDIFSGVLYGLRVSIFLAISVGSISLIIGIILGSISGYFGGTIDNILMRITDMIMILPTLIVALVVTSLIGRSIFNTIFILSFVSWPSIARIIRANFLTLKEQSFVDSAKIIGCSKFNIIFDEILPNALPPAIVSATYLMSEAILYEAAISFLGLGDRNMVSLGYLFRIGFNNIRNGWWLTIFPGAFISLLSVLFNLIGDGVSYAGNPEIMKLK